MPVEHPDAAAVAAVYAAKHAVILANPPYVVQRDPVLKQRYRDLYESAHGNFGLGLPFTERLFDLAAPGGYIAQITSNAFMKREHGKVLVERVLPRYDLTHVIDLSGAYIPGHGTPTVILAARNRPPTSDHARAVLGRRGEPATPKLDLPGLDAVAALDEKRGPWKPVLAELAALGRSAAPSASWEEGLADRLPGVVVLTAAMLHDLEVRARWFYGVRWAELGETFAGHLRDVAERVCGMLPDGDWLDPSCGVNPTWGVDLPRDLSDRVRALVPTLPVPFGSARDTDWMGDIYQGTQEWAREGVLAFCQTPNFVRDFLLRLALEPALADPAFGFERVTVCDPACGAGHLLLGAFWRLFDVNADPEDGAPEHTYGRCAEMAAARIRGGDFNPEVAAIARWRLALAVCAAGGGSFTSVPDEPGYVVVGGVDALTAHRERPGKAQPTAPARPAPQTAPTAPTPPAPSAQLREQLSLFGAP